MSVSGQEDLAPALQALDSLAASLVDKASPIRFSIAQSPAEREAAYRLRCQALIDRGAAQPEDFPDGLERDEFDDRAIQALGWSDDRVIATGRLVLPAPGMLLPTEQSFGLAIEPRGQVVDIGRFTVLREFAQKETRFFIGLLGFCWLEAHARGYIRVCGTASAGMLRHYRRIGFIVTELAAPHVYYGEERFPCWYDVVGSVSVLLDKWATQGPPNSHG
jgi:N-acyl-L-homoserine lactone synthetase